MINNVGSVVKHSRRWFQLAFGLSLALLSSVIHAQHERGDAPDPVVLLTGMEAMPLGQHIQILRDDGGALTFDDIHSRPVADRFADSGSDIINHGFTGTAYWYRLILRNPAEQQHASSAWVFELKYPMLDYVDVHLTRSDGSRHSILTGDQRRPPPASEQLLHRSFALPLQIAPGETLTLHLRVQTSGSHDLGVVVWTREGFQAKAETENLWYGVFYGIMLVMTLYNVIIYLWIRDRAYLYYVLYTATIAMTIFAFSGHARQYGNTLFASAPAWINASVPLLLVVMGLFGTLFGREFMQTRQRVPRVHRLTTVLVVLALAIALLNPALSVSAALRLGATATVAGFVVLLSISIYLSLQGVRVARFYLLAWSVFIVSLTLGALASFGVLPLDIPARNFTLIGVCIDVNMLSIALADRINTERKEKFAALSEALAAHGEALAAREQALADSQRVERLKDYLPQQVAELVAAGGEQALLEPKRREVTVCVIDLRGFTPFSEMTPPEEVMAVLREFYSTMGDIVEHHGGTVEHFAGDSMLIFFNAPLEIPRPEERGVKTALKMRDTFESLRTSWARSGHDLGLGIGMASGYATIGAIGFSGRSQYAAIGAVTNLASRLCSIAAHGEILTTARFLAKVESVVESEPVGEQNIRGFHKPIRVVRLMGIKKSLL